MLVLLRVCWGGGQRFPMGTPGTNPLFVQSESISTSSLIFTALSNAHNVLGRNEFVLMNSLANNNEKWICTHFCNTSTDILLPPVFTSGY